MFAKVTDCSVDMDLLGVYCSPKKQETDLLPSLFYLNVSAKVQFGKKHMLVTPSVKTNIDRKNCLQPTEG